jgi:hypothetical protein
MKIHTHILPVLALALSIYSMALPARAAVTTATSNAGSLSSGLVGYWTFDGKQTSWVNYTTKDASGQGNTASMVGFATTTGPVAGKAGQALNFNGSNTYTVASDAASLDSSNITVAGWYKFGTVNGTYQTMVAKWYTGVQQQFVLQLNSDNKLGWWTGNGSTGADVVESATTPAAGKWYYIVVTISGTSKKIYINGVLDNSGTGTAITSAPVELTVGSKKNSGGSYFEFFNGQMDDIRMYNRALSASEVQKLYTSTGGVLAKPNTVTLSTGLVGYWPFDGAQTSWSTNTTKDISGSGLTGTMVSLATTTAPVAGKIGQALYFNGSTSQISSSDAGLPSGSSARTISMWVYPKAFPNFVHFISYGTGSSGQAFAIETDLGANSARLHVNKFGSFSGLSTGSLTLNKWNHIVVTYNGSTVFFYINGQASGSAAFALSTTLGSLRLGKWISGGSGESPFNGYMDDVRIYNRALSASEVSQLYNQNATGVDQSSAVVGPSTGLVGYWTLDGSATNWNTNTTRDASGNGRTGTLMSLSTTTTPVTGKVGQAFKLTGTANSYVKVTTDPLNAVSATRVTIAFWAKPSAITASTYTYIGGNSDDFVSNNGINLVLDDRGTANGITGLSKSFVASFKTAGGGGGSGYMISFPNAFDTTSGWHHYVATYDGTTGALYKDGVAQSTQGSSTYFATGNYIPRNATFAIGAMGDNTGGTHNFNGSLDDVRIYSRVLTAAEVQQLYSATK